MRLPFLKNRTVARVEKEPLPERLINASPDELVDDNCIDELFEAIKTKDAARFQSAIEALVLNMFDWGGENDGTK